MPQNFAIKKASAVSKLQSLCTQLLDLLNEAQALKTEMIDDGFAAGAPNAITDTDLQTGGFPSFPALQATDLVAAFVAINTLDAALAANARTGYKALSQMRP